jgi:hypothetical protein
MPKVALAIGSSSKLPRCAVKMMCGLFSVAIRAKRS